MSPLSILHAQMMETEEGKQMEVWGKIKKKEEMFFLPLQ